MARSRNIKPSFFTSEQLSENCPLGRLLFIGLWTLADYKGDLEWKEKTIKVQILPWDDCSAKKLAINLDKSGLIRFYSDGIKIYCNIPNFTKHQNPHKNEKLKGSDIPSYTEEMRQAIDLQGLTINRDKSGLKPECSHSNRADSLLRIPDSPILIPETISPPPSVSPAAQDSEKFDHTWQGEYQEPVKPKKPKADGFDPKTLGQLMPKTLEQAWIEWIEYRKQRKFKTVEKTWINQAKKLSEWGKAGHDPVKIIEQSIGNGWQGLFELKQNFNGGINGTYQQRPKESAVQRCERQAREIFADASAEEANQRFMGANDADLRGEVVQSGG
jgi:hypothetical protein